MKKLEALATPLYLSTSWTLLASNQLFTQTAVTTVVTSLDTYLPFVGGWLFSQIDLMMTTAIFVYTFAWVFVLSSVIPSVLLGKSASVLVQFFVCLSLTFAAFALQGNVFSLFNNAITQRIGSLANLFYNPILAIIYLSTPFLIMLTLDIRSKAPLK